LFTLSVQKKAKKNYLMFKRDKVAFKKVYTKYYDACKTGKVILSTKQYAPIK